MAWGALLIELINGAAKCVRQLRKDGTSRISTARFPLRYGILLDIHHGGKLRLGNAFLLPELPDAEISTHPVSLPSFSL